MGSLPLAPPGKTLEYSGVHQLLHGWVDGMDGWMGWMGGERKLPGAPVFTGREVSREGDWGQGFGLAA